jgi:uncharacterized protein YueI
MESLFQNNTQTDNLIDAINPDQIDDEYLNLDLPIEDLLNLIIQQAQDVPTNQRVITNIKENYPFGNILENNKPVNHIRIYFCFEVNIHPDR